MVEVRNWVRVRGEGEGEGLGEGGNGLGIGKTAGGGEAAPDEPVALHERRAGHTCSSHPTLTNHFSLTLLTVKKKKAALTLMAPAEKCPMSAYSASAPVTLSRIAPRPRHASPARPCLHNWGEARAGGRGGDGSGGKGSTVNQSLHQLG